MYRQNLTIWSADVSMQRKLRLSVLFRMAQDAVIQHTTELGVGKERTLDRGFLWVIARQTAFIHSLPSYQDAVVLETWPGKTKHMFFPRYTRLLDSQGRSLVELSSFWALIDSGSRSLILPEREGICIPEEVTGNEFPLPGGQRPFATDRTIDYLVPYSAADINGHLANYRYLDLAEDAIEEVSSVSTPKVIHVSYHQEIRYGESVTISYGCTGTTYGFSGDGKNHKFSLIMEY